MKKLFECCNGMAATFVLLLSLLFLSACGGGDSTTASNENQTDQVGSVALFLTDAPSQDFDEINVTIHEIQLLPDDDGQEKVSIFKSEAGETIDLLKLETESTLFALDNSVPAGWYNKIRLRVSKVELVTIVLDSYGTEETNKILAKLPGNGKIDLNPKDPFYVAPGETIAIEYDMDVDKSIHLVQKGGRDQYNFRPVVFVKIMTADAPGKLVRLSGYVWEKDDDSFILCPEEPAVDIVSSLGDDFPIECSEINITVGTSLFDENGDVTDPDSLGIGMFVQVIGKYHYDKEDSLILLDFDAHVVMIGSYLRLEGTIKSQPEVLDEQGSFFFKISPGQGITGEVLVMAIVPHGTKVYNKDGEMVDLTALKVEQTVVIDGVLDVNRDPDVLKAAIIVSGQSQQGITEINGVLQKVGDTLTVQTDGLDPVCVEVTAETGYYKLTVDDQGLTQEPLEYHDIVGDEVVRIYVQPGDPCSVAEDVFVLVDLTD